MSDKEVERNVRSTTVEGIRTPTERNAHNVGERYKGYGKKYQAKDTKQSLLEKFRKREQGSQEKVVEGEVGGEPREPEGNAGGEDAVE